MSKTKLLFSILLISIALWHADLFAKSPMDSLEIYDPFKQQNEVRRILANYFSILGSKNEIKLKEYAAQILDAQKSDSSAKEIKALINTGDVYFRSGVYPFALTNYFLALKKLDKQQDSIMAALIELKIGRTYYFSDLAMAIDVRPQAYRILQSSNDPSLVAYGCYAEALVEQDPAKRAELQITSIELQSEIVKKNPRDTSAMENLSMFLNANGREKEALALAEKVGNGWLTVLYLNNMGYAKVLEGKYQEALPVFFRSLRICKDERFKTLLRNTFDNIGRAYRLMGRLDKAVIYMELQHYVEESLFREEFALQASEFKVKIDADKKDFENEYLKREAGVLTENIALEKFKNFLLLVTITGVSFTAAFIYRSRRKIKSAKKQLDIQKSELEHLLDLLRVSEENLKNAQRTAHLANWELDIQTDAFTFSDHFPELHGTDPEKLKTNFRDTIYGLIHPEDKASYSVAFDAGKEIEENEYRIIKNGSVRWIKAKRFFLENENGELCKRGGTVQDITDIKNEEKIKIQIAGQQSFTRQLLESQEDERRRIAGELHDSLGQDILLVKNWAQLALQSGEADDYTREQLTEINDATTGMLNLVREIAFNLRPAHLEHLGITETLASTIKRANGTTRISISHHIDNIDGIFSADSEIIVFRIVQEAVNNILKHSKAETARIEIRNGEQEIIMVFTDDGVGFPFKSGNEVTGGFGLMNIANRIRILNGTLQFGAASPKGARLEILLPKEQNGE